MRLSRSLDSTISSLPWQLKVAPRGRLDIICVPFKNCGCSSVVEHLLAKEDVASSSLVTRSSLRLERSAKRRLERVRHSFSGGGPPKTAKLRLAGQPSMNYVYLLKSQSHPEQVYLGSTRDLRKRLKEHNDGRSLHTAKFRPWILLAYFAFVHEKTAIAFEKYLKSGSGRAFVNRHFL
jgi:putative endonuclease